MEIEGGKSRPLPRCNFVSKIIRSCENLRSNSSQVWLRAMRSYASGCLLSQGANARCGFIGGIAMRVGRGGRGGRGLIEVAPVLVRDFLQLATCDFLVPTFRDGRLIVEWLSRELQRVVVKTRLQNLWIVEEGEYVERGVGTRRFVNVFNVIQSRDV